MNGLQNNHQSSTGTTYKLPSSPLNRILPGHGSSGQIKETNHLQGRGAALPWDILLQPHAILHLHRQSLRSTREESSCTEPTDTGLRGRWYHELLSDRRLCKLLTPAESRPSPQEPWGCRELQGTQWH